MLKKMNPFRFHASTFSSCVLSVCLAVALAMPAWSLGLGKATLHTVLNEPLLVTIPLTGTDEMTLSEIKSKIASPDDFNKQGVERNYIHSQLRTRVVQNTEGFVLEVYTREPFKEAWINFLVDVQWPKGKILREENLLIDLPR